MKSMTVNISMPKGLYDQAKRRAKKYHYNSVSEVIRDALRWWLNDKLTRNGFTPEFEEEVLRSEKLPVENDIEWDGKGSFTEFVLREGKKKYDKNKGKRSVLSKSKEAGSRGSRVGRDSGTMYPMV